MTKTDEILNHVITIKEDIATVKEHLKTLNSKVATNVIKIEENKKSINQINLKLAVYTGAVGVLLFVIEYFFNHYRF